MSLLLRGLTKGLSRVGLRGIAATAAARSPVHPMYLGNPGGFEHKPYEVFTQEGQIQQILKKRASASSFDKDSIEAVSTVVPFRCSNHVIDNLIDWSNIPNDHIYQLTFPQPGMLSEEQLNNVKQLIKKEGKGSPKLQEYVKSIWMSWKPKGSDQAANVPRDAEGRRINGLQHKYKETCLCFPRGSQFCHSNCTYCFRWAQFVGVDDFLFEVEGPQTIQKYAAEHKELQDILFTGGDPTVLGRRLKEYLEPLLDPKFDHIQNIRIGTKSLTYYPYLYVTHPDADEILKLLSKMVDGGKHVSMMVHNSHYAEFAPEITKEAIRRLRSTGVNLRCQSPVLKHINDESDIWYNNWKQQVKLGMIPYYMFQGRDTGPKKYFELPLARTYEIFTEAFKRSSGLARTVRGPSMSASPGKIHLLGIQEVAGEKVFILKFLQARNPEWCNQPFFAHFDPEATWLDGDKPLRPAFGAEKFFFEDEYQEFKRKEAELDAKFL
eukprot:GCRY01000353.1.p1 GENE.GCRY01000353.1~~GCRY01000353.1.p1  ORF type:complete len:516 (-),score=118.84 GCRY01000353.1:222-1697(-)